MMPMARANRLIAAAMIAAFVFCCQSSVHNGLAFPISVTPYVRTGHDCASRSEHLDIAWSDNGGFGGSHDNPFQGEKASADCGHEYRQFEPNMDDNVVVGEVFKKYVDT